MSTPISGSGASGEQQIHGEQDLILGLASGDSQALSILMSRHWSAVLMYASGFLEMPDAAEDVAQTAFVRLWEGRMRWREDTTPRGLLFRIVRNLALNERRHAGVKAAWHDLTTLSVDGGGVPQSDEVEADELRRAADHAISKLSPRRREVFELARFHGLSYREIGEALDISPQTVANQMSAALTELRDRLAPFLDATPLAASRIRSMG